MKKGQYRPRLNVPEKKEASNENESGLSISEGVIDIPGEIRAGDIIIDIPN